MFDATNMTITGAMVLNISSTSKRFVRDATPNGRRGAMDNTTIEWTQRTWNPVEGCSDKSDGCDNRYARDIAARFSGPGGNYEGLAFRKNGRSYWTGEIRLRPDWLDLPLTWRKPRKVFVNSMSDLFHPKVPFEFVDKVFAVMARSPKHTFQILTKRPQRMASLLNSEAFVDAVATEAARLKGRLARGTINEESRAIPGFPGYFVSNLGEVFTASGRSMCAMCNTPLAVSRDAKSKFCGSVCREKAAYERKMERWTEPPSDLRPLAQDEGDQGHRRVTMYRDGTKERRLVHHLVLGAFDRPKKDGEETRHLDGDATNNAITNLRWGTPEENWQDRLEHGRARSWSKLTPLQVEEIRARVSGGANIETVAKAFGISSTQVRNIVDGKQWATVPMEWPLPNCWLGTSVEDQRAADERIPHLLDAPAAVRFLSCEPLLGPLDLSQWLPHSTGPAVPFAPSVLVRGSSPIHWVIVGGESGPHARPCEVEWVRSLVRQCREADVGAFVKQLGFKWAMQNRARHEDGSADVKGGEVRNWPEDLRLREFPKTGLLFQGHL